MTDRDGRGGGGGGGRRGRFRSSPLPTAPAREISPGETPPGEGTLSAAGPRETHNPPRGWAAVPLVAVLVLAAFFVGFFFGYALLLLVGP